MTHVRYDVRFEEVTESDEAMPTVTTVVRMTPAANHQRARVIRAIWSAADRHVELHALRSRHGGREGDRHRAASDRNDSAARRAGRTVVHGRGERLARAS